MNGQFYPSRNLLQLICLVGLLTALFSCRSKEPEANVGAIIDTAIPNGLVPGAALTLKGRDFGTVQSVQFANTTVAAGTFMRTATNELTLRVPSGTQAGTVRVVSEKGPGQPKQMTLLTDGSGLTADNVSTNVGNITQGYVSDLCNPKWFMFCLRGSCLSFYNPVTTANGCSQYGFTIEQILGVKYNVYKSTDAFLTLKYEQNKNGVGFTGFVIIETLDGNTYLGNTLKNGSVVGYSIRDGSVIKLCQPVYTSQGSARPCSTGACSSCL